MQRKWTSKGVLCATYCQKGTDKRHEGDIAAVRRRNKSNGWENTRLLMHGKGYVSFWLFPAIASSAAGLKPDMPLNITTLSVHMLLAVDNVYSAGECLEVRTDIGGSDGCKAYTMNAIDGNPRLITG